MMKKRVAALLLSGVLAVSVFAGCGTGMDKMAVVATDGTTEISLGVANFTARFTQAQYDDFYVSYLGEEAWKTDMYGSGTTNEDSLKSNVLDNLITMYTMKNHMGEYHIELTAEDTEAISAAAEAFMSANSAEAIEALGAEREIVETYLTLVTIQNRMYDEIIKGADTNVSDEEAKTSAYSQVYISKTSYTDAEGNAAEYTEEELALLAQTAKAFSEAAKTKGLQAAAEAYGYDVTTGTYNADATVIDEIKTALSAMTADGQVSDLIETDTAYIVVQMDAVVDADATEANREAIISERQSEFYTETIEGYMEGMNWEIDEKLWAKVTFDNLFTLYLPETETVEGTEVETTEAE